MKLVPLGDQAVLVYTASEDAAIRLTAAVRKANPGWLEEVVPAYASVGVFFDARTVNSANVIDWLTALRVSTAKSTAVGKTHRIPVCYERELDLARVAKLSGLKKDDVIKRHTATEYTVYAIGFVPGFPYLGYLPPELSQVPRLDSPRTRVEPGSVGLTGRQTGIYPLARPGGWNLIGRTPVTIVDVTTGFFPLRVGDTVQFERIDEAEYTRRDGQRLESV
ncbi:5-oxoprolinase subunit PxpB [soil metagenome]